MTDLAVRIFERKVREAPSATALAFRDRAMAYEELDRRANATARRLVEHGVAPDVPVGLFADRGLDLVIGFLAILKAGGAVVPLDPGYPQRRLELMVETARLRTVVAARDPASAFASHVELLALGEGLEPAPPTIELSPDNLAYIIYTSGSTGQPKGVMVTHRGLANLAASQIRAFRIEPSSRVLQFASVSFDAFV